MSTVDVLVPEVKRVSLGVYLSRQRDTAIVFKQASDGVWFMTMSSGKITTQHMSDERFLEAYPLTLEGYPLRKAVRTYRNSLLRADEKSEQVMKILLREV